MAVVRLSRGLSPHFRRRGLLASLHKRSVEAAMATALCGVVRPFQHVGGGLLQALAKAGANCERVPLDRRSRVDRLVYLQDRRGCLERSEQPESNIGRPSEAAVGVRL